MLLAAVVTLFHEDKPVEKRTLSPQMTGTLGELMFLSERVAEGLLDGHEGNRDYRVEVSTLLDQARAHEEARRTAAFQREAA